MSTTFATRQNAELLDETYQRWLKDPESVEPSLRGFCEGFHLGFEKFEHSVPGTNGAAGAPQVKGDASLQTRVDGLVYAYRTLGHTIAQTNPLARQRPQNDLLSLRELGFSEKDLELTVASKYFLGGAAMTLREMRAKLEAIFCEDIGFEFMHITNPRVRNWLRERIENRAQWSVDADTKARMLRHINEIEAFERFLHTVAYKGQKRFSIEGGESLISALDAVLENCPRLGVEEITMGMAHRGRLAIIVQFLRKPYSIMFREFDPNFVPDSVYGDGDVKYHLGYVNTRETYTSDKNVDVRLSANPSHLEAVNPVVIGMTRARQRHRDDTVERSKVVPILIHGDAAMAGQGIVAEVLNMSQLPGYRVGGTIHIITNNQIGFTTLPEDARSSQYCTDVAKMVEAPVFHVNGDNPLAVRFCAELAFEFRQQFKRDVVVDIVCYRRHGHNETDEPAFTSPDLYREIASHPSVGKIFQDRLVADDSIAEEDAVAAQKKIWALLEQTLAEAQESAKQKKPQGKAGKLAKLEGSNYVIQPAYTHDPVDTAVSKSVLGKIIKGITTVPDGFNIHPRVKTFVLDKRRQALDRGEGFDWATAEALAWGSLLVEGKHVRLSGQDCRRGTFSQRHAYFYDTNTRDRWCPLNGIAPGKQGKICIYNSLLSEAAVLGFDYGYSLNYEGMLCQWEAQFGDFVNGAQVIIDQFIVSAESKWQRPSGIVLLLPHGYEGQGPEHSSARLERFLQLCAEDNIQVANLTTSAQYFHILRRQMMREFRKPLVLMTPKSMLRLDAAASKLSDFTEGRFREIFDGTESLNCKREDVTRIIFSSGKVFHDLIKFRDENQISRTAFVRIEQLYPLHEKAIKAAIAKYPKAKKFVWCQEEPENMGAWRFIAPHLRRIAEQSAHYAGRDEGASTAVGSKNVSDLEQAQLVRRAFEV
ncbi:MAG: 2-oxoglutarate dehydrogenase E1 component [Verrucomicrobia bacterium]|nr:2-oxoglutarate dehydrogenase E1 component [Verrucomicrobiota bacterium]